MLKEVKGKKILVTGGAGFIGSHLVDRLSVCNDVVVLDNLSSGSLSNLENSKSRIAVVKGDVLDKRLVKDVMNGVEIVFHLAGKVDVAESIAKPLLYMNTNVIGTCNVLDACRDLPMDRFVFASSAAVYGDAGVGAVDEKYALNPMSPYGVSKAFAEECCLLYHRIYGVPTVILRYFNVYGARQKGCVIS